MATKIEGGGVKALVARPLTKIFLGLPLNVYQCYIKKFPENF